VEATNDIAQEDAMTTIADRAAEILAGWDADDAAAKERLEAHTAWVTHMVEVERIRPETLPCIHGTAFWPDRGQVCTSCESEAEAIAYDYRTPEEVATDRQRAALAQAEREAAHAAEPDSWTDHPF